MQPSRIITRVNTAWPADFKEHVEVPKRALSLPTNLTAKTSKSRLPWPIQSDFTPSPIIEGDMIIAVMGPTGAGKSTFINVATGQSSTEIGHGLESCTQAIRVTRCQHPYDHNCKVVFVDTPGFDDTRRSDVEILTSITNWLAETYGQGIILSGLLFFHRISDNRFAGTPLRNLEMFKKLCGNKALRNVVLMTTMWDEVDELTGEERLNELQKNYWAGMIAVGSRVARFDYHPARRHRCAWDIVGAFSTAVRSPLLVQREMVDEGRSLPDTSAGGVLFGWLESLMRQFRDIIRRLETILRGMPKDGEATDDIRKQAQDARRDLDNVSEQSRILRQSSGSMRKRATNAVRTVLAGGSKRPSPSSLENHIPKPEPRSLKPSPQLVSLASDCIDEVEDDIPERKLGSTLIVLLRHAKDAAEISSVPFIKGPFKLALTIAESIEAMKVVDEALVAVASNASRLLLAIKEQVQLADISHDMEKCIMELENDLQTIQRIVEKLRSKPGLVRYFLEPADRQIVQACEGRIMASCKVFELRAVIGLHQSINQLRHALPATRPHTAGECSASVLSNPCHGINPTISNPWAQSLPRPIAGYITNEPHNGNLLSL